MEFSVGGLYFMVRYGDVDELYIAADSMVFIGKNLEGLDQGRDAWYFQDAHSYCEQGPLIKKGDYLLYKLAKLPIPTKEQQWKETAGPDIYI